MHTRQRCAKAIISFFPILGVAQPKVAWIFSFVPFEFDLRVGRVFKVCKRMSRYKAVFTWPGDTDTVTIFFESSATNFEYIETLARDNAKDAIDDATFTITKLTDR